jgi:hypothetical protein
VYAGDAVIGRHKTVRSRNGKRTAKRVTDRAAWEVGPDAVPALIDRSTFEAAQQRFKDNKHYKRSSDHPGNPLSGGIGKCVNCGGTVSIERNHPESSGKKAKYYFFCVKYRRWKTSPRDTCGSAIPYDDVIERIRSGVALYLATAKREVLEKAIASFNRRSQSIQESAELRTARAMLATLDKQKSNVLNAIKNSEDVGMIPALTKALNELEQEHDKQRLIVAELESEQRVVTEPIDSKRFLRSALAIRQRLRDGEPLGDDLLRSVFARVYLDFTALRTVKAREARVRELQEIAADATKPQARRVAAADELAGLYARGLQSRIILVPRFDPENAGTKATADFADQVPESAVPLLKLLKLA